MKPIVKEYDAFISYRHNDLDSFVAEHLHKELEAFRLPKYLAKQRKAGEKTRITRVFRDREELPIASNLSMPIQEALENSEFLIVICTPRLRESVWCQREIETLYSCMEGNVFWLFWQKENHRNLFRNCCREKRLRKLMGME